MENPYTRRTTTATARPRRLLRPPSAMPLSKSKKTGHAAIAYALYSTVEHNARSMPSVPSVPAAQRAIPISIELKTRARARDVICYALRTKCRPTPCNSNGRANRRRRVVVSLSRVLQLPYYSFHFAIIWVIERRGSRRKRCRH